MTSDTDFVKRKFKFDPTLSLGNLMTIICIILTAAAFGFQQYYRLEFLEGRMGRYERVMEELSTSQKLAIEALRGVEKNNAVLGAMFDAHMRAMEDRKPLKLDSPKGNH